MRRNTTKLGWRGFLAETSDRCRSIRAKLGSVKQLLARPASLPGCLLLSVNAQTRDVRKASRNRPDEGERKGTAYLDKLGELLLELFEPCLLDFVLLDELGLDRTELFSFLLKAVCPAEYQERQDARRLSAHDGALSEPGIRLRELTVSVLRARTRDVRASVDVRLRPSRLLVGEPRGRRGAVRKRQVAAVRRGRVAASSGTRICEASRECGSDMLCATTCSLLSTTYEYSSAARISRSMWLRWNSKFCGRGGFRTGCLALLPLAAKHGKRTCNLKCAASISSLAS